MMKLNKAALVAAMTLLPVAAFAADIPNRKAAPIPYVAPVMIYNWTGF